MIVGVGAHRAVSPDDALGFSRRPGGEDHVRGLLGRRLDGAKPGAVFSAHLLEQLLGQPFVHDDRRTGLAQDGLHAFRGNAGLHRHARAAGLEHREHRDDVPGASGKPYRHRGFAPDPACGEPGGQSVGEGVQLAVAQRAARPADRGCFRRPGHDLGEPGVDAQRRRQGPRTRAAQRGRLVLDQDADLAQRPLPVLQQSLGGGQQPPAQAQGGGGTQRAVDHLDQHHQFAAFRVGGDRDGEVRQALQGGRPECRSRGG